MITPQPETITPEKAEKWLNKNNSNRHLRPGLVEKYARDMKDGNWTNCAAPIWFYENGDVADGQHRLWAIVESGTTQRMLVGRGLSREDGLNIDTGLPRTLVDNAKISGSASVISHTLIALTRGIEEGDRAARNVSNAAKLEVLERHREAAEFAVKNGARGNRLKNAVVNAAIARAWYYEEDKAALARFGAVLSSGFGEGDKDSAPVALRNFVLEKGNFADSQTWRESFLKAQNAVYYFMRGKPLRVIKPISEERYPPKWKSARQFVAKSARKAAGTRPEAVKS